MKAYLILGTIISFSVMTASCSSPVQTLEGSTKAKTPSISQKIKDSGKEMSDPSIKQQTTSSLQTTLIQKYRGQTPTQWGEQVMGVKTHLNTSEKVVALTFDACGGEHGNGYDKKLIRFLQKEEIPATLFINSRWIDANMHTFRSLADNPLFEIENHGFQHRPLSVNGKSAYGIPGTENVKEAVNEIMLNQQKIKQLTGKAPRFFRSGTAYYDEVSVRMAEEAGLQVVNFDIRGDAGATYSKDQVKQALLQAKPGSIILLHMNRPAKGTAEGVIEAIPLLRNKGFQFVKLNQIPLK
ncbi:polysaccharide deacetylase family protein [Melghirimyces algeriensis]|uniref:Peptidoglycan/xylan/chitin deacetylase, PgdA/CDA1 family n=1 Tax=Melghirimyces algeriensis TaxID=910412 RepID=A0A521BN52_9BACL|nr:polysaccharide deacetylase family protein [Melghirimyces algeriensis]SMO48529.1 Peptidoglycan/xylan/chitin deacetylase, PgdA/CDA1 family [Melghirimyces algeriensis]